MVGFAEAAVDDQQPPAAPDGAFPLGGTHRHMAVDDVGNRGIQAELGQDAPAGIRLRHLPVIGVFVFRPGGTVGDKIAFESGDPVPAEEGGDAAAPKVPHEVFIPLPTVPGAVIGLAGGGVRVIHERPAGYQPLSRIEGGEGAVLLHGDAAVEEQVLVAAFVQAAIAVQEPDMPLQPLASPEGEPQGGHQLRLRAGENVGIGGIHRGEIAVVEGIHAAVNGHGALPVIDFIQQPPVIHPVFRMPGDELALQLELDHRHRLVNLGEGVHAAFKVPLVVRVPGHEPGAVLIGFLGEGDHIPQADAVAVFHNVQGVVLQRQIQHAGDASLAARRRAHPEDVVVAPLDVHAVVGHQQIQNLVRPGSPVVNIAHDVQPVHRQPLDQGGQGDDKFIRPPHLDNGGNDVLIIPLLVSLVIVGVQQLVDDIFEFRRQGLAHLGPGVFGGGELAYLHQPVKGDAVPVLHVDPFPLDLLDLFRGIINQGGEPGPFLLRHGVAEGQIHLFPDDAGAVVENMAESLLLPMEVAHEMLGALGKVEDGVEIDQLGTHSLDGGILPGQQLQVPPVLRFKGVGLRHS